MKFWGSSSLNILWLSIVAGAMALTILLPAELWSSPDSDGSYSGFDPVVMYVDPTGSGHEAGTIELSDKSMTLSAVPGSSPLVHLATSPLSYTSSFTVALREARQGSDPFRVIAWAPFQNYQFVLSLESEPSRRILLQKIQQGEILSEEPLGVYSIDQTYRVNVHVDRAEQSISIEMKNEDGDSFTGDALLVEDSTIPYGSHVISAPVPAVELQRYTLDTSVRLLDPGAVGISIEWLNAAKERINVVSQWERRDPSLGWSGLAVAADAPAGTAFASVEVATADGANALFTDAQLQAFDGSKGNLLPNGDFSDGTVGWRRAEGSDTLVTRSYEHREVRGHVSQQDWPELFEATRLAVTVESSSSTGLAVAHLEDHELTLDHDRWLAVRTTDPLLSIAVAILGGLGVAFIIGTSWRYYRKRRGSYADFSTRVTLDRIRIRRWVGIAALMLLFLAGNALLSRVGSSNADVVGARTWGYTASTRGFDELYFAPNLASAEAEQWNGLPLQEAGFPYGPTMAYITAAQGLAHRYALDTPGVSENIGTLNLMAKLANSLFALADAVVIYLIIDRIGQRSLAWTGALLFLLNPAIWFAGSVWGSSQAVSLLFLLLAVYLTQRRALFWAWTFVLLSTMARPQYAIPALLLAIYLAREVSIRDTILAVSKAVIVVYVFLLPFSLSIGPTLPIDNLYNAFFLHVGSGNDAWTLPLSWGGLTIWPLVAPLFVNVSGISRVLFPAQTEMVGTITFFEIGTVLTSVFVVVLAMRVLFHRAGRARHMSITVVMAASTMALFTLKTGTPTYHFILPLALIIAARHFLPRLVYWTSVAIVSTTTFVSMYAMGSYWLTRHPTWSVGIYDERNPIARGLAAVAAQDWYITVGSIGNLIVLALLMWFALAPHVDSQPIVGLPHSTILDPTDGIELSGIDSMATT